MSHAWLQRLEAVTSHPSQALYNQDLLLAKWGPQRLHFLRTPKKAQPRNSCWSSFTAVPRSPSPLTASHCDTLAAPLGAERPSSASLKWLRGSLAYCLQLQLQSHEHLQRQNPLQPWRLHHSAAWVIFQSRMWAGPGWETACITAQPHHTV